MRISSQGYLIPEWFDLVDDTWALCAEKTSGWVQKAEELRLATERLHQLIAGVSDG